MIPGFPRLHLVAVDARPSATDRLIAQMAAYLRRGGLVSTEREAVRALADGPFRMGDVAALAGAALLEAQLRNVATEMRQ